MSIYYSETKINRTLEEVWNYISDISNARFWVFHNPKIVSLNEISFGVGSRYKLEFETGEFYSVEIVECIPKERLKLAMIDGIPTGSWRVYNLSSDSQGNTILKSDLHMKLKGFANILYPLLMFKEFKDREYGIKTIKKLIEKQI